MIRTDKAYHSCKGFKGREALIRGSGKVVAHLLKLLEKGEDELGGKVLDPE
jgi:hypothetical protein